MNKRLALLLLCLGLTPLFADEWTVRKIRFFPNEVSIIEIVRTLPFEGRPLFPEMNTRVYRIYDRDGVATLGVLHVLMTEDALEEMAQRKASWEDVAARAVPHWAEFLPAIERSLKKAKIEYHPHRAHEIYASIYGAIDRMISAFQAPGMTFGQMGRSLSSWLHQASQCHAYSVTEDDTKVHTSVILGHENSSRNPLGTNLSAWGDYAMPPRTLLRGRERFAFDATTLIETSADFSVENCGALLVDAARIAGKL